MILGKEIKWFGIKSARCLAKSVVLKKVVGKGQSRNKFIAKFRWKIADIDINLTFKLPTGAVEPIDNFCLCLGKIMLQSYRPLAAFFALSAG